MNYCYFKTLANKTHILYYIINLCLRSNNFVFPYNWLFSLCYTLLAASGYKIVWGDLRVG